MHQDVGWCGGRDLAIERDLALAARCRVGLAIKLTGLEEQGRRRAVCIAVVSEPQAINVRYHCRVGGLDADGADMPAEDGAEAVGIERRPSGWSGHWESGSALAENAESPLS